MALIKCPECGKEFSDKASACPNCAFPLTDVYKLKVGIKLNEEQILKIASDLENKMKYTEVVKLLNSIEVTSGKACCRLASLYERGIYVESNIEKAIEYYMAAIKLRDMTASKKLGELYLSEGKKIRDRMESKNISSSIDENEVIRLFSNAIRLGNIDAKNALKRFYINTGYYLLNGKTLYNVPTRKDENEGVRFFEEAIKMGDSDAREILALYYAQLASACFSKENENVDIEKSFRYRLKSLELGYDTTIRQAKFFRDEAYKYSFWGAGAEKRKYLLEKADYIESLNIRNSDPCASSQTHQPSDTQAKCPVCSSSQVSLKTKGFGLGKAVVGGLLLGPAGLLAGAVGSNKNIMVCLKCGHEWQI